MTLSLMTPGSERDRGRVSSGLPCSQTSVREFREFREFRARLAGEFRSC